MINIDDREIRRMEKDLKLFARGAYPFATRATLNSAAFEARRMAQENIREDFINRNRFTEGSIRVDRAVGVSVDAQAAIVGSIAPYMGLQEIGGSTGSEAGRGQSIPTAYAAGQAMNAQPRTKLPRKPNRLENIRLRHSRKRGATRQQRNVAAVKAAAGSWKRYVYLDLGRRRGIFRVVGSAKRPTLRMVYDMSRTRVVIGPRPWLSPAVQKSSAKLPQFYAQALTYQLKRRGIF